MPGSRAHWPDPGAVQRRWGLTRRTGRARDAIGGAVGTAGRPRDEGALEAQQLRDRLLVGGGELVVVELVRGDPAVIVDADVLDLALGEAATIDAEVDVVALVPVLDVDHAVAHLDR